MSSSTSSPEQEEMEDLNTPEIDVNTPDFNVPNFSIGKQFLYTVYLQASCLCGHILTK